MEPLPQKAFEFLDLAPNAGDLLEEVQEGLLATPKHLPAKYFYDKRGSELFEQITEHPGYYLTRSELDILQDFAPEISRKLGKGCFLVELGSGNCMKTRFLLDTLQTPAGYSPVDICSTTLRRASVALRREYPHLELLPVCADFTRPFPLPEPTSTPRCTAIYFAGSTIGNFTPRQTVPLLEIMASALGPGGVLLVGIDLKKDPRILHRAYNDARGITAAFNLNLLARINRELGADFQLDCFRHYAFYNPTKSRVEMHLVSTRDQVVSIEGQEFSFHRGENIVTEYSYKYRLEDFAGLASDAGFELRKHWTDRRKYFGLLYLEVVEN